MAANVPQPMDGTTGTHVGLDQRRPRSQKDPTGPKANLEDRKDPEDPKDLEDRLPFVASSVIALPRCVAVPAVNDRSAIRPAKPGAARPLH
jgi:hypothetical protein